MISAPGSGLMKKDCVTLASFTQREIENLFSLTDAIRGDDAGFYRPLRGKTAALIFEKQSLRTHVSFEVGITQLGGQAVFLSQQQIGVNSRESVKDVAQVLSCYNDLIIARTMSHRTVEELAAYASVPVINALSDLLHPCQILADAYTLRQRGSFGERTKIAFIGDGNNIVNSWLELAALLPFHFVLACPPGYEPDAEILALSRAAGRSAIEITGDCRAAAAGADVLYTDVWVSMGQESEREQRLKDFRDYQINAGLLALANRDCAVMHCLPAHRGEEITEDVLEGANSVVLGQAENRLHVQKALMTYVMTAGNDLRSAEFSAREKAPLHA